MHFRKLELEDQPWFPKSIRAGMTDYLRFIFRTFHLYAPVVVLLERIVRETRCRKFIDLCSGSGGAVDRVQRELSQKYGIEVEFVLTDKYPQTEAYRYLSVKTGNRITFLPHCINALEPLSISGFRTMFSGIHHFSPAEVKSILHAAVKTGNGIAIFDGGNKSLLMVLLIIVFHPPALLLFTPFIRPFRWSRLLFTYIIPVIPVATVWDGVVSILNLYRPCKLLSLAQEISNSDYTWKAGKIKNAYALAITYLIGYPRKPQGLQ